MATKSRRTSPDVIAQELEDELLERPSAFNFVQAVRLLALLAARNEEAKAEAGRLGLDEAEHDNFKEGPLAPLNSLPKTRKLGFGDESLARFERVRFATKVRNQFQPNAIFKIEALDLSDNSEIADAEASEAKADETKAFRVWSDFFSLAGQQGPLPSHYNQQLQDRAKKKDHATAVFLDLFQNRLLALYYRAQLRGKPQFEYELCGEDSLTKLQYAIAGCKTPEIRQQLSLDSRVLPRYSGLLSMLPKSALSLKALLNDYFRVPVEIQEFKARTLEVEQRHQSRLGSKFKGQNQCLGKNLMLGQKSYDMSSSFKIVMGPMSMKRYEELLPFQKESQRISELVKLHCGPQYQFEVQLEVKKDEVTNVRLQSHAAYKKSLQSFAEGSQGLRTKTDSFRAKATAANPGLGSRLGWTTWLGKTKKDHAFGANWLASKTNS